MLKLFKSLKLDSILKYAIATILIVVPLYPKFPVINVPGTYVAIRAEDFIIAFSGLVWFVYILKNNPREFFKDKLNQAIFLFFAAGLLSVISAAFITKTVDVKIALFHYLRRIEYILPFFIASTLRITENRSRFFVNSLLITTFLIFLYGFGQVYASLPVISTQNEEYSKGLALRYVPGARLHATFAGHYDLAAFLVLLLPITIALTSLKKNLRDRTIFTLLAIMPAFWLMIRAESRVSFVAYLGAVVVSLWFLRKKLWIVPIVLVSIGLVMAMSNLGVRYRNGIKTYWERLISIDLVRTAHAQEGAPERIRSKDEEDKERSTQTPSPIFEDRSTAIRLNIEWPRAIRAFAKNPLLGTGYSSITLATDNDYLRVLGETGLAGALAFTLILLRIFQRILAYIKKAAHSYNKVLVIGFLGGFAGMLINATFIDVFEASKVAIIFWTLAGIVIAITKEQVSKK